MKVNGLKVNIMGTVSSQQILVRFTKEPLRKEYLYSELF